MDQTFKLKDTSKSSYRQKTFEVDPIEAKLAFMLRAVIQGTPVPWGGGRMSALPVGQGTILLMGMRVTSCELKTCELKTPWIHECWISEFTVD